MTDAGVNAALRDMGKPMPIVKFVLMTHTAQLATLPGGATYREWSKTGTCAATRLPAYLVTSPKTIHEALLGRRDDGVSVIPVSRLGEFYDGVVGIGAGPGLELLGDHRGHRWCLRQLAHEACALEELLHIVIG